MKVGFLIQRFHPVIGGSEKEIKEIAYRLYQKGHDVEIWTTTATNPDGFTDPRYKQLIPCNTTVDGMPVRRFGPVVQPYQIHFSRKLTRIPFIFESPGPFCPELYTALTNPSTWEIVYTSVLNYHHLLPSVLLKRHNVKLVCKPCIHLIRESEHLKPIQLAYLMQCDAVLANTVAEKKALTDRGIPADNIHTFGVGVEPDEFIHKNGKRFRSDYGLHDKEIILFVGAREHDKGIGFLLDTIPLIFEKRSRAVLMIFGPFSTFYKSKINSFPKRFLERFIDLGIVNDIDRIHAFDACDVFVLPSIAESFGITYLEAWMCEKPVIGAITPATCEVIHNNTNGILVKFGDKDTLAAAITGLLDNKEMARSFGIHGKQKTLLNHTWKHVSTNIEILFSQLIR
ncbi:MAG: glycosyltransferase family 4 protein [Desulfobacterales bacterium]|nr:glycosyltransferase family 4 protein [Desulfobacterales bacterium]